MASAVVVDNAVALAVGGLAGKSLATSGVTGNVAEYFIAFDEQTSIQSKQFTQRLASIFVFLLSMQCALHLYAHKPQCVHLSGAIRILKIENLFTTPRIVPVGQMALQNERP
jgi:hypothetical protein